MSERVYWPEFPSILDEAILVIDGDEGHHLGRVRRIEVGDAVELFDGRGNGRRGEVLDVVKDRVTVRLVGPPVPDRVASVSLTLASAVPKGDRLGWLVEKATELGVSTFVPILTDRSVVDPRSAKLDRLRKSVIEACKQCGRNRLMTIENPTAWSAFLRDVRPESTRLIAHPGGLAFSEWPTPATSAVVAIGPEGGFTERESGNSVGAGFVAVSLGPTLLRVETAAIVASARVLARIESVTGKDETR